MDTKKRILLRTLTLLTLCLSIAGLLGYTISVERSASALPVLSQNGSKGEEVRQIQQRLTELGIYSGPINGNFGPLTEAAVRAFQQEQGISVTGVAGPITLKALGISETVSAGGNVSDSDYQLLARIISAEARGEPYIGQVAVGAVVLNRVEHPSFPDTIAGVVYQPGAFSAINDGQIDQPIADSAYRAAKEALNGSDPSGGAIYYYNPDKTSNKWIRTRPVIKRIGQHLFCS